MTRHVVVDGSNLATEGRSMPSLTQLNEAVLAYMAEHPQDLVTVVVDATFGHRIDAKEVSEFDDAVANNELVAPPAGAVGRGDAFVLSIANKVGAVVLSNDSFQEFHAQYSWLFDEGRLIGGKPVPHIGWVFVPRNPVRGPVSRKAVRDAKKGSSGPARSSRKVSKEASQPMPVPTAPPPGARISGERMPAAEPGGAEKRPARGRRGPRGSSESTSPSAPPPTPEKAESVAASPAGRSESVNPLMPFLEFVERHPVGTTVSGEVESYSSHGAYVQIGDVRGYVPLRNLADPAPRSAREVLRSGENVDLVVASFNAPRRSIDLVVPSMAAAVGVTLITGDEASGKAAKGSKPTKASRAAKAAKATKGSAAAIDAPSAVGADGAPAPADPVPAKQAATTRATTKKSASARKTAADKAPPERTTSVGKASPKRASAAATKAGEAPAPAEKAAPATKSRAKKAAPPTKRAAATSAPATKRAPAAGAPASKAPAPVRNAPKKAAATKQAAPKKAAATKNSGAEHTPPKRAASPAKKSARATASAKKAPVKKSTSRSTPS
jgi:hypothetical protein